MANLGWCQLPENLQSLRQTLQSKQADMARVAYLQGLQAPGKIAIEFLNAVAQNVDPSTRRVRLENYQLFRESDGVKIIMTGVAQASGSRTLGDVLDSFRRDLQETYPSHFFDCGFRLKYRK